jgi:hypothetical protein
MQLHPVEPANSNPQDPVCSLNEQNEVAHEASLHGRQDLASLHILLDPGFVRYPASSLVHGCMATVKQLDQLGSPDDKHLDLDSCS